MITRQAPAQRQTRAVTHHMLGLTSCAGQAHFHTASTRAKGEGGSFGSSLRVVERSDGEAQPAGAPRQCARGLSVERGLGGGGGP